jgi:predicted esterase
VTIGDAAPYLIHRPSRVSADQPTIVFLAGGSGGRSAALRGWETIFAGRPEPETFQVILPYSTDVNFIDEAPRVLGILNDVLACFGGDQFEVHIAGTSNGGLAAFALMASHPETFATLLGAPGAFPVQDPADLDPAALAANLAGRAVFNGVGVNDDAWRSEVIATHNALVRAGIESVLAEFPGQGHILSAGLDPSAFFDFWRSH